MNNFYQEVEKVLKEAEDFEIEIINFGKINILENLKKIERTGKKIRLKKLNCPRIKIRTVYDHVHSVLQTAKVLIDNEIIKCDYKKLISMLVYHDFSEVLITDFPVHTKSFGIRSKSITNVMAVESKIREEYATNFLWLFANKKQKAAIDILKENNEEQELLWVIDKIDPIINVWRYMCVYNKKLKKTNVNYIEIMDDFFTNPVLDKIIELNKNSVISEILIYLKNIDNARLYLKEGKMNKNGLSEIAFEIIITLVENTFLFYK